MGWNNIKQAYFNGLDVHVEQKDIVVKDTMNEVFRINTINFEVAINSIYKTSNAANAFYRKLQEAKKSGELKRLFDQPDAFKADIPVFTIKGGRIVKELCESHGFGKTTHSGERMTHNFFPTRKEAKRQLRRIASENLRNAFRYSFLDGIARTAKGAWKTVKAVGAWIKARTS